MRVRLCLITALMITLLCGCNVMKNEDYNNYQRMYKAYNGMTSYQAEAEITINSNNTQNKYVVKQFYQSPGKTRSETISPPDAAGVVTVVDGQSASVFSPRAKAPTQLDNLSASEMNYLFLSSFFETYFKSETTSLRVSSGGGEDRVITLRADTGLENPYRKAVTLKADTKTLKPISLEITGADNKVYAQVVYKSFTLNPALDPALFTMPPQPVGNP